MAKKETTAKKAETKKKSSNNKPATKKQTNKVTKVTEEQLPKIAEEVKEQTVIETVDLEQFKDENGEYDLTNTNDEEVKSAINQLENDGKIFVVKNEEEPLEVVNGDPSVIAPVEEKVEEVVEKEENTAKKITRKLNQYFGYFWNGQAIDY